MESRNLNISKSSNKSFPSETKGLLEERLMYAYGSVLEFIKDIDQDLYCEYSDRLTDDSNCVG